MDVAFRLAERKDLPQLLEFTRGYYTFEGIDYVEEASAKALSQLICSEHFGRIWLILLEGTPVGYSALTFGYSLAMGGRDAFIDELFLIEAARGKGIGKRVMDFMKAEAHALGIKALHLEVGRNNEQAQRLYKMVGFQGRQNFFLMTFQPPRGPRTGWIG